MVIRLRKIHAAAFMLIFALAALMLTASKPQAEPAGAASQRPLAIVMYHHLTETDSLSGKYVLKTCELESDLRLIRQKGYSTVTVSELIDYVNGKGQLSEKIIMLTFDDGFESVYQYALPLLEKYNMKAVVSPVGSVTELYTENHDTNIRYAYMTWQQLKDANEGGRLEVQNHSYDLHYNGSGGRKGLSRRSGESKEQYEGEISADLITMQRLLKENSGVEAQCMVYPYGLYEKDTVALIKKLGFKASMTCEERINSIIVGDSQCLYNLGRFNRPSGVSSEKFFERLLK